MNVRSLIPVLLTACCVAGLAPARAADRPDRPEEPRTITVTGNAEVRSEPDRVHAVFGIESQASTAREAQAEANRVIQRVLESLRRLNIPPRNIQTSGLTLQPMYEHPRPPELRAEARPPRIVGYRATNTLTVLVENVDQIGPVIDAAMAGGANTIRGVRFGLKDDLPQRMEALRLAGAEARRKAEAIATALGVTLGPVRSANETNVRVFPAMAQDMESFARAGAGGMPATPVAPGEVVVEAMVNVVYDIGGTQR